MKNFKAPDNSQGIKDNHVAGINRVVKLVIHVDGKQINSFKHFKLKQSAAKHHEFELILPHDALSERQDHQLEQANKFLGKRLTTVIKYKDFETKEPLDTEHIFHMASVIEIITGSHLRINT